MKRTIYHTHEVQYYKDILQHIKTYMYRYTLLPATTGLGVINTTAPELYEQIKLPRRLWHAEINPGVCGRVSLRKLNNLPRSFSGTLIKYIHVCYHRRLFFNHSRMNRFLNQFIKPFMYCNSDLFIGYTYTCIMHFFILLSQALKAQY